MTCLLVGSCVALTVLYFGYRHFSRGLPDLDALTDFSPPSTTFFISSDGRIVGSQADEEREPIELADVPDSLILAFLAAEDRRFFRHSGVDLLATGRALVSNLLRSGRRIGASTVTQQLCKTIVGRDRTYKRKIREAICAVRLESKLSKADILARYLNHVYLGHGAYGVAAASRIYFDKRPHQLTLGESAMLAGLPPQPSRVNPVKNFNASRKRQRYVLNALVSEGVISRSRADQAYADFRMPVRSSKPVSWTPYYLSRARRALDGRLNDLGAGGYRIHLGVDLEHQRLAQEAVWTGAEALGQRQGYTGPIAHFVGAKADGLETRLKKINRPTTDARPRHFSVGLVKAVDRDQIRVSTGYENVSLNIKEMGWTKPYKLDARHNRGSAKSLLATFRPGDVIVLSGPKNGAFRLVQFPPVEAAFMALDNHTRQLTAAVGGLDYAMSQFDRSEQACRSPGSTFKPIVYAQALEQGMSLATVFDDTPLTLFDRKQARYWKPRNPDGRFAGSMIMMDAIQRSANIPAIRALRRVGARRVAEMASQLGVREELYVDDSLALGGSCTSLASLLRVYSAFALGGDAERTIAVERVIDRDGQIRFDQTSPLAQMAPPRYRIDGMLRLAVAKPEKPLSETTGYLLQQALQRVVRSGTGRAARIGSLPLAGKTGTTDKFDAWFAGFSHRYTALAWIGADKNERPLGSGETGGRVAAPIWRTWMASVHNGDDETPLLARRPAQIIDRRVDLRTGLLTRRRHQSLKLSFKKGTEPTTKDVRPVFMGNGSIEAIEGQF
ncbi:MAG: transglycosylase domain-containing protein [Myxococcota bacterium]|nr:transglycosylase domain-containing protein [Myxococcota bacterium]